MNAIDMLKEDHDRVRQLLEQLANTTENAAKQRPELLAEIEQEVRVHTRLEEEIFYPAVRKSGGKQNDRMVAESWEEHRAVKELVMPDVKQAEPTDTAFSGRAKVLKELLEHHLNDEEEELFPQARETLSERELNDLGERMAARRQELQRH